MAERIMVKPRIILLAIAFVLCMVGAGLVWYSSSLPQDLELFSKYSGRYAGNTNLMWVTGMIMTTIGVTCSIYWLLTPKLKTKRRREIKQAVYGTETNP